MESTSPIPPSGSDSKSWRRTNGASADGFQKVRRCRTPLLHARKHGNEFTLPAAEAEPCPPGNCTECVGVEHDRTTRIAHDREAERMSETEIVVSKEKRLADHELGLPVDRACPPRSSFPTATGTGPFLI